MFVILVPYCKVCCFFFLSCSRCLSGFFFSLSLFSDTCISRLSLLNSFAFFAQSHLSQFLLPPSLFHFYHLYLSHRSNLLPFPHTLIPAVSLSLVLSCSQNPFSRINMCNFTSSCPSNCRVECFFFLFFSLSFFWSVIEERAQKTSCQKSFIMSSLLVRGGKKSNYFHTLSLSSLFLLNQMILV